MAGRPGTAEALGGRTGAAGKVSGAETALVGMGASAGPGATSTSPVVPAPDALDAGPEDMAFGADGGADGASPDWDGLRVVDDEVEAATVSASRLLLDEPLVGAVSAS